jgi:predicted Zn-dependent protease
MNNPIVCPDDDLLMVAALGEPAVDLEPHLRACSSCRQRIERLRALATTMDQTVSWKAASETATDDFEEPLPRDRPAALGKYLVVGELGKGGQARVFRGLDPGLDRDVAIKWAHKSASPDTLDYLSREGKLLAGLEHPGIARVFDLDVHEGRPFLVMEYVRGCDLEQYAGRQTLSPRQSAALVASLARALAYAHAKDVIHQDVKPGNILVDELGRPRLADFGLAQCRDLWHKDAGQPGGGTLDYMSPEQLRDPKAVGRPSDLYALGGVLFFLLTGRGPRRQQSNPILACDDVHKGEVDWAPLQSKKVPRRLQAICRKALAPDPAQRYQEAEDLADDLQRYVDQPRIWGRRLGALAACVACAVAAWFLLQPRPPQGQTRKDDDVVPRPSALRYFTLGVRRDNQRFVPTTQKDLENVLPFRARDVLDLEGSVPSGMHVGLFTLTLTDPEIQVRERALETKNDRFRDPRTMPLQASPATELLLLCGSPEQTPRLEKVASLLADLLPKTSPPRTREELLAPGFLLSFQSDAVDDPFRLRIGEGDIRPELRVLEIMEQIRLQLRQQYPFVAGLAFTHVADAPNPEPRRIAPGPGLDIPGPDDWGGTPEDKKLFQTVMDRLLQSDRVRNNYPSEFLWPPQVFIKPQTKDKFNAIATCCGYDVASGKRLVCLYITEGYLDKVVIDDEDILAAIMGHELAHITRGHLLKQVVFDLPGLVLSRDQEFQADLEGVQIAMAAGCTWIGVRAAYLKEREVLKDRSDFEGLKGTHPTWEERLALLDKAHVQFWKAMSAFQNGYFFLHAEQYKAAEDCFQGITEQFPDCAEAWANLGYARLMQYCDDLEAKDLRKYGLAQFVAGCCYARPTALTPRGGEKQWRQAIDALQKAIKSDSHLVLAQANLGLAYLVDPDGRQIDKALEHFRGAYNNKGKGLDDLNLASLLINHGVAELAGGQQQAAADKFHQARNFLAPGRSALGTQLESALLYNEAVLAAGSADKHTRSGAFRNLEAYLNQAGPDSTWWTLAYEKYEQLGKDLGLKCQSQATLAQRSAGKLMRMVTSVEVAPGKVIKLGDQHSKATALLDWHKSDGVPIYPTAAIKRFSGAGPGLDLLAHDNRLAGDYKILAIFLTSDKAPPLHVQAQGRGAKKLKLRVGMSRADFLAILKDQILEETYVDNRAIRYVFFPRLGLGVRFAGERVSELVVAQVPRRSGG